MNKGKGRKCVGSPNGQYEPSAKKFLEQARFPCPWKYPSLGYGNGPSLAVTSKRAEIEGDKPMNDQPISRENIAQTRRELISNLEFLLQKGFEQAYQLDKSLLTLSAGALALSLTFVGNLSGTKHYLFFLFVAWAFFTGSIIAVIFAMRKAQLKTHDSARETADNLEQFSNLHDALAGIMRATFPVGTDNPVARLNRIAIWSFVIGVIFLCLFVGSNLLTSTQPKALYSVAESRPAILTRMTHPFAHCDA